MDGLDGLDWMDWIGLMDGWIILRSLVQLEHLRIESVRNVWDFGILFSASIVAI